VTVRAVMRSGETFRLRSASVEEVMADVDEAVERSLTGSLSAANDIWLSTVTGGAVRYTEVVRFETGDEDG